MNDTVYSSDHSADPTRLRVSEDIVPLGEFRSHTARVLGRMREQQRAVVITQNGRPAAVLVTPEEYDRLQEPWRFLAAVGEGLADASAGRVVVDEPPHAPAGKQQRRSRR
jgi:prevent-host-death family protein